MKERLIGAAVLVAVGVWLIPWVLDGPPETPGPDGSALQLPAPPENAPMRSQTLRLTPDPTGDSPASRTAASAAASAPRAPEQTAAATPASAPAGGGSERTTEPPTPAPSTAAAEAPRAAADTGAAASSRSTPLPAGDWVVQLGSFGDAANAERLANRVGTYGYDARVSDYRAGGRTMHRVRVGPHATRDQADAVASSLSAHGFVAQVVTVD